MNDIDYYNCSPCDFISRREYLLSICEDHGYKWDNKIGEFVSLDEVEDMESL